MSVFPPPLDPGLRSDLLGFYEDLHQHPELAFQEYRTAERIAKALAPVDSVEVTTGVGGTGVVAVLRNGTGPTVLLRADIDALPLAEETGLPFASRRVAVGDDGAETPVMHACGHDMHATCLVGALTVLGAARERWSGTIVGVFQPAEEIAAGARAMVADGLFERFPRPDVVLGQHVVPLPAGTIGYVSGTAMAGATLIKARMFGRGGHGSRPETTVDPVVMASAAVLRLQSIVAREITAGEPVVVTVGYIKAGSKANIIGAEAELGISVRTFSVETEKKVLEAVERILNAEAAASDADRAPEIDVTHRAPLLVNDGDAQANAVAAFTAFFGPNRITRMAPVTGSEDVGVLAAAAGVPIFYWFWGGTDPDRFREAATAGRLDQEIPSNHSPLFAPVPGVTLETGVHALTIATLGWLA